MGYFYQSTRAIYLPRRTQFLGHGGRAAHFYNRLVGIPPAQPIPAWFPPLTHSFCPILFFELRIVTITSEPLCTAGLNSSPIILPDPAVPLPLLAPSYRSRYYFVTFENPEELKLARPRRHRGPRVQR
jgi:hypothetical protein